MLSVPLSIIASFFVCSQLVITLQYVHCDSDKVNTVLKVLSKQNIIYCQQPVEEFLPLGCFNRQFSNKYLTKSIYNVIPNFKHVS